MHTDADGIVDHVRRYTYDNNQNLMSYEVLENDALSYGETYTYDENGNRLTMTSEQSGVLSSMKSWVYDSEGNLFHQDFDSNGDEIWFSVHVNALSVSTNLAVD